MSLKRWKLGWKRCDCVKCEAALTIEQTEEDCGWVRWGDHKEENARLKAEVERLISVSEAWKKRRLDKVEDECIKWSDYEKLKAENERLRKAGDAMASALILFEMKSEEERQDRIKAWSAAKEGKQP